MMLILQIINVLLGSGLLGLPLVVSKLGLLVGGVLIATACLLSTITCIIQITALEKYKLSYTSVANVMRCKYGKFGCYLVLFGIFMQDFGSLISYLFILIEEFGPLKYQGTVLLVGFLLWLITLDLGNVSVISVTAMVMFVCYKGSYVFYQSTVICIETETNYTRVLLVGDLSHFLSFLPTVFFSVACQAFIGVKSFTETHLKRHTIIAMSVVCVIYIFSSITEVLAFPVITDNSLNTMAQCTNDLAKRFVIGVFKLGLVTTIPVLFISICSLFPSHNPNLIKITCLFMAVIIAFVAESLLFILTIFGSISGVVIVIIIPFLLVIPIEDSYNPMVSRV